MALGDQLQEPGGLGAGTAAMPPRAALVIAVAGGVAGLSALQVGVTAPDPAANPGPDNPDGAS